jgi:hypothetical protein
VLLQCLVAVLMLDRSISLAGRNVEAGGWR